MIMVPSTSLFVVSFLLVVLSSPAAAFQQPASFGASVVLLSYYRHRQRVHFQSIDEHNDIIRGEPMEEEVEVVSRRSAIAFSASLLVLSTVVTSPGHAVAEDETKFVQSYNDFTITPEGWSFKEVKLGKDSGGGDLRDGDRVVFDWSGYTIGYFGRPFEAKGGPQGGAFDKDVTYFRTVLGSGTLIPGCECALRGMKPGGIRQIIVPYGPLSYPPDDKEHDRLGPKPTTFSGMRALNFVLETPRVDRTLLFNIKLVRIDRSDGRGGFVRG